MFGFLCPKGDEREAITEANRHKAVSPATATSVCLCVSYCEDAGGGAAGGGSVPPQVGDVAYGSSSERQKII